MTAQMQHSKRHSGEEAGREVVCMHACTCGPAVRVEVEEGLLLPVLLEREEADIRVPGVLVLRGLHSDAEQLVRQLRTTGHNKQALSVHASWQADTYDSQSTRSMVLLSQSLTLAGSCTACPAHQQGIRRSHALGLPAQHATRSRDSLHRRYQSLRGLTLNRPSRTLGSAK